MGIEHKAWNWKNVSVGSWDEISEEFLPVALQWCERFETILDVGAGRGRHALFFAKNGLKSSAVDLSPDGIEIINEKANAENVSVETAVADMTALPYQDETFNGVVCFHTIYHTDYEGVKKAISEIYRVLKYNGEAYITFNSMDNPNFDVKKTIDGHTILPEDGDEKGIPHCYLNWKDLYELLKDFSIVSMNETINFIHKSRPSRGIHYYVHLKKV